MDTGVERDLSTDASGTDAIHNVRRVDKPAAGRSDAGLMFGWLGCVFEALGLLSSWREQCLCHNVAYGTLRSQSPSPNSGAAFAVGTPCICGVLTILGGKSGNARVNIRWVV